MLLYLIDCRLLATMWQRENNKTEVINFEFENEL